MRTALTLALYVATSLVSGCTNAQAPTRTLAEPAGMTLLCAMADSDAELRACSPVHGRLGRRPTAAEALGAHLLVQKRIRPEEEPVGQPDDWRVGGVTAGDCDDFALAKRELLLQAGFSSADLRLMAVDLGPLSGKHLVLRVETDLGPVVLDNLRPSISTVEDYDVVATQGPDHPRTWHPAGDRGKAPFLRQSR